MSLSFVLHLNLASGFVAVLFAVSSDGMSAEYGLGELVDIVHVCVCVHVCVRG